MTELALKVGNQTTITSLEIARLTGKEHGKVLLNCNTMFKELGLAPADFGSTYKDSQNKAQKMFVLDKELSFTLVSGYSIVMRNAIIKRWQELETQEIKKELPVTARELSLAYGKLAEAEEKLALSEKKVTDLFESDGTYTSKELASHLNLTIRQFNQYLIDTGVCMFTKKGYILTPAYLNKGMAEVKLEEVNPGVYRNIFYWTEYGRFTIIELQRLYDLSLSS